MTFLRKSYRHSAFSGNLMLANPSLWLWRQGYERWSVDSPRAQMGHVVEAVVVDWLSADIKKFSPNDLLFAGYNEWDLQTGGLAEPERDYVGPIAWNMLVELAQWDFGAYRAAQVRPSEEKCWLEGLKIPCRVHIDQSWDKGDIDLKATLRLPSDASKPHLRQMALYALIRGKPQWLLYSTPKKSRMIEVHPSEVVEHGTELIEAFRRIEALNDRFGFAEELTRIFPLSSDYYGWDDGEVEQARKVWNS